MAGLSESPKPGRSIAITRWPSGASALTVVRKDALVPPSPWRQIERRALTGGEQRPLVVLRLDALEAQALRLGGAARRGQQADPQVQVAANPEPTLAKGVHATANVVEHLRPGGGVGGHGRVGTTPPSGRLEQQLARGDASVEVLAVAHLEADPGLAARHVHVVGVEPLGEELNLLAEGGGRPLRCGAHGEDATQPGGRYAQTFASVSDLTERRWGQGPAADEVPRLDPGGDDQARLPVGILGGEPLDRGRIVDLEDEERAARRIAERARHRQPAVVAPAGDVRQVRLAVWHPPLEHPLDVLVGEDRRSWAHCHRIDAVRGRRRLLADDGLGRLVVAQALEGGMAERAGGGPLGELDLGDQLRLGEDGALLRLAALEGADLAAQRLEALGEQPQHVLGEAGPDLAGEAQVAIVALPLPVADQQRADPAAAATLTGQPAADHDLLAAHVLDLEPVAAALAGPVGRGEAFGHDSLEPALLAQRQHRGAVAAVVARRLPALAVEFELGEALPPLVVGDVEQGSPVEVKHVEGHEGDRGRLAAAGGSRSPSRRGSGPAVAGSSACPRRRRRPARRRAPPRGRGARRRARRSPGTAW